MNVAIGCDEAARELKTVLKDHLRAQGHAVTDFGTHGDESALYPDIGIAVAEAVAGGKHERAVLLCGTGIGMAISANKVAGIRAAQAHDTYSAERASRSNDAQVITIGSRVVGPELAKAIVDRYLGARFEGGPSSVKLAVIAAYEGRKAQATGRPSTAIDEGQHAGNDR